MKYATEILEQAHMLNCNPCRTPIDTEKKLGPKGSPVTDPTLYRSLVGSLQYLTFTRPDLSYAVQQVVRLCADLLLDIVFFLVEPPDVVFQTSRHPQALRTAFEAQVRDYLAAHTERLKRLENSIFKQREEINDRMTQMFILLKELTTREEEKNDDDNVMIEDSILDVEMPLKDAKKKNEAANGTKNKPIKSVVEELTQAKEEEAVEAPNSQPVGCYLKHRINKKLIKDLYKIICSMTPYRQPTWAHDTVRMNPDVVFSL
nr:ribonuclease H-like domain-containing protein [Tanacetum cinerariifolium]